LIPWPRNTPVCVYGTEIEFNSYDRMKNYFKRFYHKLFWFKKSVEQLEDGMTEIQSEIQKTDNVISMFGRRSTVSDQTCAASTENQGQEEESGLSTEEMFQMTMKRNADIQKRLRDSRTKANKSVLRSYRIKK